MLGVRAIEDPPTPPDPASFLPPTCLTDAAVVIFARRSATRRGVTENAPRSDPSAHVAPLHTYVRAGAVNFTAFVDAGQLSPSLWPYVFFVHLQCKRRKYSEETDALAGCLRLDLKKQ